MSRGSGALECRESGTRQARQTCPPACLPALASPKPRPLWKAWWLAEGPKRGRPTCCSRLSALPSTAGLPPASCSGNRAPVPIFIHTPWLTSGDNLSGVKKFVGEPGPPQPPRWIAGPRLPAGMIVGACSRGHALPGASWRPVGFVRSRQAALHRSPAPGMPLLALCPLPHHGCDPPSPPSCPALQSMPSPSPTPTW